MKCRTAMLSLLVLSFLTVCRPMFGHHGVSAYEVLKTTAFKATITKFEFSNPHSEIFFDAADENGNVVHWVAETINPAMLARIGWTRNSLKPGDQVTLVANPNKVGAHVVLLQKVVFDDGQELGTKKGF